MFLKDWIKQLGPCSINRSIECTNEIIKFIDKNKKSKSSYEMYKMLRDKGYIEKDLKNYFYDNYYYDP